LIGPARRLASRARSVDRPIALLAGMALVAAGTVAIAGIVLLAHPADRGTLPSSRAGA
jgi:hypothetical protein